VEDEMSSETVAILGGTGNLGFGLAVRLAKAGVPIVIGSRDAGRAQEAAERALALVPGADVSGEENAAATARAARVVFIAVPFASSASTVKSIAEALREDQIVVDVTVPLGPAIGGKPTQLLGVWQGSAAQQTQSLVPKGVRVVSALHTISGASLENLDEELDQDTLVCGDRKADKEPVIELISKIGSGLRPVDAGRLEMSRIVEGLTPLLIGINIRYKTHSGVRITGV
jgi:NADPH-dependent F420 reductase